MVGHVAHGMAMSPRGIVSPVTPDFRCVALCLLTQRTAFLNTGQRRHLNVPQLFGRIGLEAVDRYVC